MNNNYLINDIKKYCTTEVVNNIYINYPKSVGIESDLSMINENNKNVGRILLLNNTEKKYNLFLDQIIQFKNKNIKWRSVNTKDGFGFYIVNAYWVKPYAPKPKIKVGVYVRVDNELAIEMIEMTHDEFKQRKLTEYYYKNKIPYIKVAAYRNFYTMLGKYPGQAFKAKNSTCKHYLITQKDLDNILSEFNNERKRINVEWNKYLQHYFQENESMKKLNNLYSKKNTKNNVIKFNKTG